jgi:hypothetical protein
MTPTVWQTMLQFLFDQGSISVLIKPMPFSAFRIQPKGYSVRLRSPAQPNHRFESRPPESAGRRTATEFLPA